MHRWVLQVIQNFFLSRIDAVFDLYLHLTGEEFSSQNARFIQIIIIFLIFFFFFFASSEKFHARAWVPGIGGLKLGLVRLKEPENSSKDCQGLLQEFRVPSSPSSASPLLVPRENSWKRGNGTFPLGSDVSEGWRKGFGKMKNKEGRVQHEPDKMPKVNSKLRDHHSSIASDKSNISSCFDKNNNTTSDSSFAK